MAHLLKEMGLKHNIRNISVIGSFGHGKSSITSCLMAAGNMFTNRSAGKNYTDLRVDETGHSFSIELTGVSLCYEMSGDALKEYKGEHQGNAYVFNIIDSPGHAEFSSELTAALRITDGALLVVDCAEGFSFHTETVLRQSLGERIRPVLAINKIDRCLTDLSVDGEEAYQMFRRVIEDVNSIMGTYNDPQLGDVQVCPEKGTVAFTAGIHDWGFTLKDFSEMYASRFGVNESTMMQRLWGDNFFDYKTNEWTNMNTGSATCMRGFVYCCYEPIKGIINICMKDGKDNLWTELKKFDVSIDCEDDKKLEGKPLVRRAMQCWLPAGKTLLKMMILHLPSPGEAQKYRVENLYQGPLNDVYANAIRNCDPDGPLMLYVSKLVVHKPNAMLIHKSNAEGYFYGFGRVFSGKVAKGLKVRIMGPNYVPGERDSYVKKVETVCVWLGIGLADVEEYVPCGNTVALFGIDEFISKTATLTNESEVDAHPIRPMKFSVQPVVRAAIQCKVDSDLPKLVKGIRRLTKADPVVACAIEETGEHIVAGAGELHLKICLNLLENEFVDGAGCIKSDTFVSFRETVVEKSSRVVMSKSLNNHNRIFMKAQPMEEHLAKAIDEGCIGPRVDLQPQVMSEKFDWDTDLGKQIWCFGPRNTGPNMVVDKCAGVSFLNETKGSVVAGFQDASLEGALAHEEMRGICFEICDAVLHENPIERTGRQIIPTTRRAIYAAQLTAKPMLMEPVYLVEFQAPHEALNTISSLFDDNRGKVLNAVKRPGTQLCTIKALIPVIESIQLSRIPEAETTRVACFFDHWELMPSDPLEPGSQGAQLLADIRKRKGLKEHMIPLSKYEDGDKDNL